MRSINEANSSFSSSSLSVFANFPPRPVIKKSNSSASFAGLVSSTKTSSANSTPTSAATASTPSSQGSSSAFSRLSVDVSSPLTAALVVKPISPSSPKPGMLPFPDVPDIEEGKDEVAPSMMPIFKNTTRPTVMRKAASSLVLYDVKYSKGDAKKNLTKSSSLQDLHHINFAELQLNTPAPAAGSAGSNAVQIPPLPKGMAMNRDGTIDVKNARAREWIEQQAKEWKGNELPWYIPKCQSNGDPDLRKAVTKCFLSAIPESKDKWESPTLNEPSRKTAVEPTSFANEFQLKKKYRVALPDSSNNSSSNNQEEEEEQQYFALGETYQKRDPAWWSRVTIPAREILDTDLLDCGVVGIGLSGVVHEAVLDGSTQCAWKILHTKRLERSSLRQFAKEMNAVSVICKHPNIARIYGYTATPPGVVMEFFDMGSLEDVMYHVHKEGVVERWSKVETKMKVLLGIADAMAQLAEGGMAHGDLKPANVMLSPSFEAKLVDVGLTRMRIIHLTAPASAQSITAATVYNVETMRGTAEYMAPELLVPSQFPNEKSDMYSFGIIMNEVFSGHLPYLEHHRKTHALGLHGVVLLAQKGIRPQLVSSDVVPEKLIRCIKTCWHENPGIRPTFEQIYTFLSELQMN